VNSLRKEIEKFFIDIGEDGEKAKTEVIIRKIEKQIDKKIQHVEEVLNDPRLTIQGCHNMKGKKEAFEEVKEILKWK